LIKTTHWHRIVSWDQKKNPFLVDRVKRGDLVFVEGPIHYRSYTAKDGTEKQLTEITLSTTHHHSEEINFCLLIRRKEKIVITARQLTSIGLLSFLFLFQIIETFQALSPKEHQE